MASRYYSAVAQDTTVTSGITSSSTSVTVGGTTGYPTNYPFILAIDYNTANEELVSIVGVSGLTLTIGVTPGVPSVSGRGYNSTTAVAHGAGAVVRHVITAQDMTDTQNHYAATTSVHGITDTSVLATQSSATDVSNATSFLTMGA
jgi:hypothetical protein